MEKQNVTLSLPKGLLKKQSSGSQKINFH